MEANINPGPSTSGAGKMFNALDPCEICRRSFHQKEVLRLVIKEYTFHVTVSIIRLTIRNGEVVNKSKNNINFLNMNHDTLSFQSSLTSHEPYSKLFDALDCANVNNRLRLHTKHCPKHHTGNWETAEEQTLENDGDILVTLLQRLAHGLKINITMMNQCVDNILTSSDEIIIDFNFEKLQRMCKSNDIPIEDIIKNIFWQHRVEARGYTFCFQKNLETMFCSRDSDFDLPLTSNCLKFYGGIHERYLLKCFHIIEHVSSKFVSWYFEQIFYKDICTMYDPFILFLNRSRARKIQNPMVRVINDNPLLHFSNFAYVVASNFYTSRQYVRQHMTQIGIFNSPIIYLQNNAPFIIRSLDPTTRKHIFHMIYKDKTYDKPTYENLFKVLTLLRDIMFRMELKHITMPKIGGKSDGLNFNKVVEMINYVFLGSRIEVVIGLNRKQCPCIKHSYTSAN